MTRSTAGNCPVCGEPCCTWCGECQNYDCEFFVSCSKPSRENSR